MKKCFIFKKVLICQNKLWETLCATFLILEHDTENEYNTGTSIQQ